MLRKLCSSGMGGLSAAEIAAMEQLCTSHRRLLSRGGLADISDEAACAACAGLLEGIEGAAETFGLEAAPRGYRAQFSANYRALFPGRARLYRVDVLETSLDRHSAIWVNGDKFELSPEAVGHAEKLQHAWFALGALLDRWRSAATEEESEQQVSKVSRTEITPALAALDVAWASFERTYISELIAIEDRARQLVVQAVNCELRLRMMRRQLQASSRAHDTREGAERELVQIIGRMNSVANVKCKGRDDLGYDILESARRVLQRCESEACAGAIAGAAKDAARILASDIVSSYDAMRTYLREVGLCIERVDPHLCNNAGLAARLVEWETSWEVGARYVRDAPLLEGLCDLVAEVRAAQTIVPQLIEMCEDFDVELFWVLPRIVMLFFAAAPTGERAELVRSLLPHRFCPTARAANAAQGEPAPGLGASPGAPGSELLGLAERCSGALRALEERFSSGERSEPQGAAPEASAWEFLVRRAVLGTGQAQSVYSSAPSALEKVVEDFMRELERWSLELQRHCPQDWNQCSAVLVQCVVGRSKRQPRAKFQV